METPRLNEFPVFFSQHQKSALTRTRTKYQWLGKVNFCHCGNATTALLRTNPQWGKPTTPKYGPFACMKVRNAMGGNGKSNNPFYMNKEVPLKFRLLHKLRFM